MNSDKDYHKECSCKKESSNIKKSVKTIEDNITKCIEKDISKLKEDMNRGLPDKCKCFNELEGVNASLKLIEAKVDMFEDGFEANDKKCKVLDAEIQNLMKRLEENRMKIEKVDNELETFNEKYNDLENLDKKHNNTSNQIVHTEIKSHKHQKHYSCNQCKCDFENSFKLELHIKTEHEAYNLHNCDECGIKFAKKWRLMKHKMVHSNRSLRTCHFYNNAKECPYFSMGCKFRHENAPICNLGENCRKHLCQFKHQ